MPKKGSKKAKSSKKATKKSSKKAPSKASKATVTEVLKATELYNSDTVYCQFDISDYKKSIKFYQEVLEWKPSKFSESSPDPDQIGWFEFELPLKGSFLGLGKPSDGKVKPSNSLVISVKDLKKFRATMDSKKANPSNITDVPDMISYLTVKDPDNNSIMFIAEPRIKS